MHETAEFPVVEPVETSVLEASAAAPVDTRPRRAKTRPTWPGLLSLLFGILTLGGLVTGILLATSDLFLAATSTAWAAVGASVLAVLLGLVAIVGRFGSGRGAAGILLGVICNPLVLTAALDLIGGLWA